jgi:hypothetical protein
VLEQNKGGAKEDDGGKANYDLLAIPIKQGSDSIKDQGLCGSLIRGKQKYRPKAVSSRLLKNQVLRAIFDACGTNKRSDGWRSALHGRYWLRFGLIFDSADRLIPLRPGASGCE